MVVLQYTHVYEGLILRVFLRVFHLFYGIKCFFCQVVPIVSSCTMLFQMKPDSLVWAQISDRTWPRVPPQGFQQQQQQQQQQHQQQQQQQQQQQERVVSGLLSKPSFVNALNAKLQQQQQHGGGAGAGDAGPTAVAAASGVSAIAAGVAAGLGERSRESLMDQIRRGTSLRRAPRGTTSDRSSPKLWKKNKKKQNDEAVLRPLLDGFFRWCFVSYFSLSRSLSVSYRKIRNSVFLGQKGNPIRRHPKRPTRRTTTSLHPKCPTCKTLFFFCLFFFSMLTLQSLSSREDTQRFIIFS